MAVKKLFISFDYEFDNDLRCNFIAQAKEFCVHSIREHSLPAAVVDRKWTRVARSRIRASDFVIFICGTNTHSAPGVEAEMTITQQLGKAYILLKGRRDRKCSKPKGANAADEIVRWKWKRINSLLDRQFNP
ncbi:MAG: hypothetical protein OXG25_05305 [Gammaproteobacteria bacterium]|nr:hypothetical protein [Gammaproteobacteria bacterium]